MLFQEKVTAANFIFAGASSLGIGLELMPQRALQERQAYRINELAKILGHANIKMTERYAKLGRDHIARTGGTAREIWKLLVPLTAVQTNIASGCSDIVRTT